MHKYLRAIGFSKISNRNDMQKLIEKTIRESTETYCVSVGDTLYGDYWLDVGHGMGLIVCGEYDDHDDFQVEHYYPYLETNIVSSADHSSIDRHIATNSFTGVVEDKRIGISIIYYLRDRIRYIKRCNENYDLLKVAPVAFSGLSDSGMILMPIEKSDDTKKKMSRSSKKRDKLVEAARQGSDEAIETLTLDDIDVYANISKQLANSDVYSIVDTCFMPYGAECDLYTIIGEIDEVRLVKNSITEEEVYKLSLICNCMPIQICINKEDLFGEPMEGRRFKGTIWLQGRLVI